MSRSPQAPLRARAEPRDFRAELQAERCWDAQVEALYEAHGEALCDCVLQNREELIALCAFIEAQGIRSYLEIGLWTGGLLRCLQRLFGFSLAAGCDDGYARRFGLPLRLPPGALYFEGDSGSEAFVRWRRALGHVDLVLIDANHGYRAARRDFLQNRSAPHRFIALHDITGARRATAGVARLWREIEDGHKHEIVLPHVELDLDHSIMGIGIWSQGISA